MWAETHTDIRVVLAAIAGKSAAAPSGRKTLLLRLRNTKKHAACHQQGDCGFRTQIQWANLLDHGDRSVDQKRICQGLRPLGGGDHLVLVVVIVATDAVVRQIQLCAHIQAFSRGARLER